MSSRTTSPCAFKTSSFNSSKTSLSASDPETPSLSKFASTGLHISGSKTTISMHEPSPKNPIARPPPHDRLHFQNLYARDLQYQLRTIHGDHFNSAAGGHKNLYPTHHDISTFRKYMTFLFSCNRMCDFTWKDSVRLESLVCPIFCYSKYHQTRVVIIFFQSIFNDLKSIPLV